jgi:hypothetical protein
MPELDRVRAAGLTQYSASTLTAGNEPLTVDLVLPQTPGEHYIIETASLLANLTAKQPNTAPGYPPLTGLFLTPIGTAPESITEAAAGWVMTKRGVLLPLGPPGAAVGTIAAGPPYAFALTLAPGYKITMPYGFMLRAIVVPDAGNAAPGPGAGSLGVLTAFVYKERDADPAVC